MDGNVSNASNDLDGDRLDLRWMWVLLFPDSDHALQAEIGVG